LHVVAAKLQKPLRQFSEWQFVGLRQGFPSHPKLTDSNGES
jgi:hypothetical protein